MELVIILESKWNVETISEYLKESNSGCILLSTEIKKLKDKLLFRCTCGKEFYRDVYTLIRGNGCYCPDCSKKMQSKNQCLSNDDYLNRLKLKGITTIIPMDNYVSAKKKILHKCNTCGYEWEVSPSNILSGYGCPVCNGGHCVTGKTDIATTHPDIAFLLNNKDDAKLYSINSNKVLEFICPECGNVLKKRPSDIIRRGIRCRICGDGISIPNKFMEQILLSLEIKYTPEKIFDWSNNKKYDFYLDDYNALIEVMGIQHYKDTHMGNRSFEEEQSNDIVKRKLAICNGVSKYYIIDFRYTDLDYMKNSFIKSDLFKDLNLELNCVDYVECWKKSFSSKMVQSINMWNHGMSTSEIADELKISIKTAIDYLNRGAKAGLCKYMGSKKPVFCITTNELFESVKEAQEKYHSSQIGDCCRNTVDYAGSSNGQKLKWIYYHDYLKLNT